MGANESILAIDIGVSSLKVAEFERTEEGISMKAFGFQEYEEAVNDENRYEVLSKYLKVLLEENSFTSKKAYVSISGQLAFSRFVKLPPVDGDEAKVRQIVEFEAKQNVPFEMNEVIWDFQLIEGNTEEMDVIFVVIKNEIVERISGVLSEQGIGVEVVDIAPTANYNAARANKIGEDQCSMVLSIGGRCSNLVFVEGNKFFCRNIPIAGHTVTQQIAKEFGIGNEEAEELKKRHGFVALGGAYEEPESEVAATISKIVRNVMTRLHGEVNRSINIYRSQQKGNKPTKLYLCGGSSIMPYTEVFFEEKLKIDVEYLNPFQFVRLDQQIDRQNLAEHAHLLSEVIGIALRKFSVCPIEINLVPETVKAKREFASKIPFLVGTAITAVIIPMVFFLANHKITKDSRSRIDHLNPEVNEMKRIKRSIDVSIDRIDEAKKQIAKLQGIVYKRQEWLDVISKVSRELPSGVWVTEIVPITGDVKSQESKKPQARRGNRGRIRGLRNEKRKEQVETASANQYGGFKVSCLGVITDKAKLETPLSEVFLSNLMLNTDLFLEDKTIPVGFENSKDFANFTKFDVQLGLVKALGRKGGK